MRIEGTLTKWNNDRGFGFITPTQGGAEIFAHVSAFPRDCQRPRLGERLTFETGTGKDGKKQARNILCPTRPAEKPYRLSEPARRSEKPYRLSEPARHSDKPGLFGRLIPIGFVIALGLYGYDQYTRRVPSQTYSEAQTPQMAPAAQSSNVGAAVESGETVTSTSFHCDGRQHCSQMRSRAEAEYFVSNCPDTKMDGDYDGIPCENDSRF
jgi:cold shock CspA family protein